MSEILLQYKRPDPTTWVYLSSLLTIGLYFVFHRFWSVRNLDVLLLVLLAPGLLMVHQGRSRQLLERETEVVAAVQQAALQRAADSGDADQVRPRPGPDDASSLRPMKTTLINHAPAVAQLDVDDSTEAATPDDDSESDQPVSDPSIPAELESEVDVTRDAKSVSAATGFTPGDLQRLGFICLFIVQVFILVRLLLDPLMVRRPLLDPNLTTGGLTFIGVALFIFMMANIVASTARIQFLQGPELGPGYALMHKLPTIPTLPNAASPTETSPPADASLDPSQQRWAMIAKVLAILAHAAIFTGIILIGNRHFGNLRAGVGCSTLYLLLPYTAQMTGRVDHAVPAALLLWAVLTYRKPILAGIFLGLAAGLVYYPLFVLPLWISFYWRRGVRRFGAAVVVTLTVLMLLLSVDGTESLVEHLRRMYGLFQPTMEPRGIWGLGWNPIWRLPVIVAFAILSVFLAIWPAQKNLGTLISCSAAVMVAAQFWHGYGGGMYIAWFLPLLLLTIFRPNLQDRVALKVVDGGAAIQRGSRLEAEAA